MSARLPPDPIGTRAVFLGTAQDGGRPQFGAGRVAGPERTAASLCVLGGDDAALLIDASPDLRTQYSRLAADPSYGDGERQEPFDGIVLTHAHMGHYAGLVHFGPEAHNASGVPCWVTPRMAHFLQDNAPWNLLIERGNLDLRSVEPGTPFPAGPGLEIRLVSVPHRDEFSDTVGVSIGDDLLYVPDIDAWDEWPAAEAEFARHATVVIDATFFDASELPGRDMAQIRHPLVVDTLRRFRHLVTDHRIVLTHLNHTNPLSDPDSPESRQVEAAGFEIAREMMVLDLDHID